ncbi:MAG: diaminopimelate epimerase [Betaproteobacteria bacterium RBG_16_64_18]|nr:MAG: diaminopimelate epimerase [Betaproteobacteria bacterium RBG_16_64_18]OGA40244.1 MAG: diaminopimelate epimerase [Betaproteobacteria bacterium RIFCSPLOWO2_12_FULL_65_110]
MKLKFTKMQGAGNDFVVLDGIGQTVVLTPGFAKRIADRHFGIGCDQILVVERPQAAGADFRYRIWNADGGEVEQCGNGARCFVRFVRDKGLSAKDEICVQTQAGLITPRLEPDGAVTVNMGAPLFEPKRIPFVSDSAAAVQSLEVGGSSVQITAVSMGNPHAVQVVDNLDAAPVSTQGPLIERHPRFPQRVNAGYMQVIDRGRIRLRVWERGAGETLACGTGACAAVVAGIRRGLLDATVAVDMRGGRLTIRWEGAENDLNCAVWMTGPAVTVFEGEIQIDES